ncbi:MAG: hypothetical protein PHC97_02925 [Patescibacteria group bacterium]|nr:hypothetical protein [Patescibacteria group bacterium]
MLGQKNSKINKVALITLSLIFIFSSSYLAFGWNVRQSHAQALVFDAPAFAHLTGTEILTKIYDEIKAVFFKNVLGSFANKIAEQTAIWVASGGNGAKPQFVTNFTEFTQGFADAAVGDFVQNIMKDLTGLDVCTLDPRLAINIVLNIPTFPGNENNKPSCTWTQMKNHWEEIGKSQLLTLNATLQPGGQFGQNVQQQNAAVQNNPTLRCWTSDLYSGHYVSATSCTPSSCSNSSDIFTCPAPAVQGALELSGKTLSDYSTVLSQDVSLMSAHALDGTTQAFSAGIGSYEVVPENIPLVRDKWLAKIDAQIAPLTALINKYGPCQGVDAVQFISGGNCNSVAQELGLNIQGTDLGNPNFPTLAAKVKGDLGQKTSYVYNSAQSIKSGYDYLKSQITQYFSPENFQGGAAYNSNMAKDFFNPDAFEFNAYATLTQKINEVGLQTFTQQQIDLTVNQGWKSATDKIGGYIETPSNLLRDKASEDLKQGKTASAYTNNIAADALGVFLETLWNQYTQRLLQGIANPKQAQESKKISIPGTLGQGTQGTTSRYSQDITTPEGVTKYIQDIGKQFQASYTYKDVNLLADFQLQITGLVNPNIYNNVIDSNFALAINDQQTIQEALDAGRLVGNYRFSWGSQLESGTYSLANIKKLRKARAVPIGLELAVELIRDCSLNPIGPLCASNKLPAGASPSDIAKFTLQEVIKGFDKSGNDGICGTLDSNESAFCNLVNPNWVLKIPLTKCSYESDLEPFGEILQSNDSSERYSRCTDFASCLQEDGKGGCQDEQYGFCVKEKNVWRLGAETCPADYDSCRTYTVRQGETTTTVSYLKNTLPGSGVCGPDNAGCQPYAYERVGTSWNAEKKIYLDANAETCDRTSEGCSLFWPSGDLKTAIGEKAPLYYRKPPAYLGCTGSTNDNPLCQNYMQICNAAEVGCQLYKPLNGDPSVPAVAKSTDLCPAECVGYSVYVQQPTAYEPEPVNLYNYFIAGAVSRCSLEQIGCSQFTNLDEVSQGGEGLHYYTYLKQCIKPNIGLGEKAYFTWQSSATGSPKIIRYQLKQVLVSDQQKYPEANLALGSPMTIDLSGECDSAGNPNCLEFFDDGGNTYRRDLTLTISVSDDCHPLRKEDSDETNCTATNGNWLNNACIYNAIPSENTSCGAEAVGCRAYTGNRGNNIFNLINDDFENASAASAGWSSGSRSNESIALGGHSLFVGSGSTSKSAPLAANNLYTISFWAKTDNTSLENISAGFDKIANSPSQFSVSAVWQNFTVGPISINSNYPDNNLIFSGINQNIYLDNIIVKRTSDQLYAVKNSWVGKIPASCDTPSVGAMLGCEAYQNTAGQNFYFKSFTNLCAENKVGCQLLIDTQNSLSPEAQTFSQSNNPADDYVVPADSQDVPYVLNDQYKCLPADKGCQLLGKPVSVNFIDVYLKNDPDKYTNVANPIMCKAEAVGCTELINDTGGSEFYQIDSTKICAFDEQAGQWLLGGSGCYASSQNLNPYTILPTTDQNYDGKVGACPGRYNGCTQFSTYSQTQGNEAEKLLDDNYFALDTGNTLDRSSCSSVDWNSGCVRFQNRVTNAPEVIKVDRDRDCAEWLVCKEKDANGLCLKTGVCDQMQNGQCAAGHILESCKKYDNPCDLAAWSDCENCLLENQCLSPSNCPNCDAQNCSTIVTNCRQNGSCLATQPTCAFDPITHVCSPQGDCEVDSLGNCVSIYDKLKDDVRYNYAGVAIPLQRIAAQNQGYIYRLASGSALATDLNTWQAGDFSGYSVPDRYPVEVELESPLGQGFTLYPKVADIGQNLDGRYEEPICKVFPSSNSPMPYEMSGVSKTKQLNNLYSPSYQADLSSLGSMCSYGEVTAGGVTTNFPISMVYPSLDASGNILKDANGNIIYKTSGVQDVTNICTTPAYRQGKWCTVNGAPKTGDDPGQTCPYSDSNPANAASTCSPVENVKIYNGIENMCLEYDTLSPVYADLYKNSYDGPYTCSGAAGFDANVYDKILVGGKEKSAYCTKNDGLYDNGSAPKYNYQTYACLTYFPLAIDVCPYYKTKASCLNNPVCNWGFCYSFDANGRQVIQTNYSTQVICEKQPGFIWQDEPCLRR